MQKLLLAPMTMLFLGFMSTVTGLLHQFSLWPYSHLSAGLADRDPFITQIPLVHSQSILCYVLAILCFVGAVIGLLTLNDSRRRYIAQFPRWQQWFIWPFHGVVSSPAPTHKSD